MPRKDGKPRGRMTAYAYFVQTCREEHKKKHPGESVVFAEFSRKCAEKWKGMGPKDKKRFEEMAEKDKARYEREMAGYEPPQGEKRKKRKKDPNAPKRALSAFFFFCQEERPAVRKIYPSHGVGDIAKELGRRWEKVTDKPRFEAMAAKDRSRYERDMQEYRKTGAVKKQKVEPKPVQKRPEPVEDDDDDDEDDDDEDDDDDDDEEEDDD